MKKQLRRTLSVIVSMVLTVSAFSSAFGASAAIYSDNPLDEWIEMADALMAEGKNYTVGLEEFENAYNELYDLKNFGVTDSDRINSAIDALKTAWNGLAVSEVTEVAPTGGKANNTGFAAFGEKYINKSGIKHFEINYNLGNPGADYWKDVNKIYVYAYAYNSSDEVTETMEGTSLPKGSTVPNINYVRLVLNNSSLNWPGIRPFTDDKEVYLSAKTVKKFEFTKESIVSKFTGSGNLIFKQPSDCSQNINAYIGSLFIETLKYENAPASYELFNWVRRAEKLLANGKTYSEGLEAFKTAVNNAKAETDEAKTDEHISAIKAAWRALKYENAVIVAYPKAQKSTDITGETEGLASGWLAVKSNGRQIEARFDAENGAAEKIAAADKVYFSIRGYRTSNTAQAPDANWSEILLNSNIYYKTASGTSGPNISTVTKEFTFDKELVTEKLNGLELSTVLLKQGEYKSESVWIVSPIYAVTYAAEQLPPDRLLTWAERAEELLSDSSKTFTAGLESFKAVIAEIYAADENTDADALIARLKSAWNSLEYTESIKLGVPAAQSGTADSTFEPTDAEKALLGENYIKASNTGTLAVRFDDVDAGHSREWFDNVSEIYFYIRGYLTADESKAPNANWNVFNLNSSSTSIKDSSVVVKPILAKATVSVDNLKAAMDNSDTVTYNNLLMTQGDGGNSTWIVGTLYAVKNYKAHITDYGDVNGDGTTNILDLIRAKKYFASVDAEISEYALDINDDNYLKADDLTLLRKLLLNGTVYSDNTVSEDDIF